MKQLKAALPWMGLVMVMFTTIGLYMTIKEDIVIIRADVKQFTEREDELNEIKRRQSLHWALIMASFEECQAATGGDETWSQHIAHSRNAALE